MTTVWAEKPRDIPRLHLSPFIESSVHYKSSIDSLPLPHYLNHPSLLEKTHKKIRAKRGEVRGRKCMGRRKSISRDSNSYRTKGQVHTQCSAPSHLFIVYIPDHTGSRQEPKTAQIYIKIPLIPLILLKRGRNTTAVFGFFFAKPPSSRYVRGLVYVQAHFR